MDHSTTFDVISVPLVGSNLIEASAGTGKTYSIAILALRLLLEKEIAIQEILMVTFTKAAVAELQERIRKFVRDAHKYAHGIPIADNTIKTIIDRTENEKAKRLLQSAIINLDETAVYTIHSFCQQSLNEFAFETKQIFSAELSEDIDAILEVETQAFWRQHVTGIEPELLKSLITAGLSQQSIISTVQQHLKGKKYIFYKKGNKYAFDTSTQQNFHQQLLSLKIKVAESENELIEYIRQNREELTERGNANASAKKALVPLLPNPDSFLKVVNERMEKSGYIEETYPDIVERIRGLHVLKEALAAETDKILNHLYAFAIQEMTRSVATQKIITGQMSFDDLINNLHKALVEQPNSGLVRELQKKYKAVFNDEFQDTDRKQYEIFHTAFQTSQSDTILFYIGDPKQSIYGWRQADIATYFRTRHQVDHQYTMNTNYRSSSNMIAAINQFFLPRDGFDTFYFRGEADKIEYQKVNAPDSDKEKALYINNIPCAPICIGVNKNKSNIQKDVARLTLDLLSNTQNYFLEKDGSHTGIKPSNIVILVRGKKEVPQIKKQLTALRIPSVTKTEHKILQSPEATDVQYILEAILHQTRATINRALLSSLTGWKKESIENLNEEKVVQQFKSYYDWWQKHGLYATLMKFVADFGVQQHLLSGHSENGERIITNLYHLAEVLYKTESRKRFSSQELVDWLKKNNEKDHSSDDEEVQRIESDEDSVTITTIHGSKGLEYPIVIAPSLDLKINTEKNSIVSFRDENNDYFSAKYCQLDDAQKALYEKQEEQENRRLLYVAITRAIHGCFIFLNESPYFKNSTLKEFVNPEVPQYNRIITQMGDLPTEGFYHPDTTTKNQVELTASHFHLLENNWQRMSYSGLAAHGEPIIRPRFEYSSSEYDTFIFHELPKGAGTGNFLHFIFENLHFSNPASWPRTIQKSVQRFMPNASDTFKTKIAELVEHVMQTTFSDAGEDFRLSDIPQENTLHELEFDFPVALFSPQRLQELRETGIAVNQDMKWQIEGMMNGKIDLFFKHKNKFYILDWKSNYLGPRTIDYNQTHLLEAMNTSNYHLQYLIYTVAVKKYLKSRLGNGFHFDTHFGGVFYVFLRGVRKDKNTGIFYVKPTPEQMNFLEELLITIEQNEPV